VNRSTRAASIERLRQERIIVYSQFLDSMTTFGSRQILRWIARQDHGSDSLEHAAALLADHETRAAARSAGYRLTLVADDAAVVAAADALMAATLAILDASDREHFEQSTDAVRSASQVFVDIARKQIRELAQAR
jgi:hypothetical protein